MKDKQYILNEIRRVATNNQGKPPGMNKFRTETSIGEHEWLGVYWVRWSDAVKEAGLEPSEWNQAIDEEAILRALAQLVRKYGRYSVRAEIQIESRNDSSIPVPNTLLRRFGGKAATITKLKEFCNSRDEFTDICGWLQSETAETAKGGNERGVFSGNERPSGYVYLVKSGKLYKIGRSENHWRRKSELHKQTAEGIIEIHTIAAIDDAPGIENYWHERFADKRRHGEWFDLSPEDVSAFKKRKFM